MQDMEVLTFQKSSLLLRGHEEREPLFLCAIKLSLKHVLYESYVMM
jgi:hypothetical protein